MARQVLVGLGANLGDPAAQLQAALQALDNLADGPLRSSSLWRSAPVDCPPGSPDFINAVACFQVSDDVAPRSLLARLLDIEARCGRQRSEQRHAPRPLDLDLLLLGSLRVQTASLTLPHPRAHRRAFVLAPLAELLPELTWPGTGRTVAQLLEALPAAERGAVRRLPDDDTGP